MVGGYKPFEGNARSFAAAFDLLCRGAEGFWEAGGFFGFSLWLSGLVLVVGSADRLCVLGGEMEWALCLRHGERGGQVCFLSKAGWRMGWDGAAWTAGLVSVRGRVMSLGETYAVFSLR